MSKHSRLIAALLTIIFALAAVCTISVYAEDDNPDFGNDPEYTEPEYTEPEYTEPYYPDYTEPEYTEPYYPDYTEPEYTEPYYPEYTESEQPDNGYTGEWYDSDGNSYDSPDDVYVGGGQSYAPPVSTAPSAPLYSTDNKIDVSELSKGDWGDIAARLKNASVADDDGTGDFSFIQQNTSNVDNGHGIIIAGAFCILLSITGFVYLIASGVIRRKKIKAGNISKSSSQSGNRYRASDDYDDGYKSKASSKKESKRTSGGRRYK